MSAREPMESSTGCPDEATLLAAVRAGASALAHDVQVHLDTCARCLEATQWLRPTMGSIRGSVDVPDEPTAACLDPAVIAELADGSAAPHVRAFALAHVGGCSRCRRALAGTVELLRDRTVMNELRENAPVAASRRGAQVRIVALAAAVVLAAGTAIWTTRLGRTVPLVRDEAGISPAPAPIAPIGPVPAVPALSWGSVPKADGYRVTIFDARGEIVWNGQTRDTTIAVPGTIRLPEAVPLYWRTEARTDLDRWTSSGLVEFTIESKAR